MIAICNSCARNNATCPLKAMTDELEEPLQGHMVSCTDYQAKEEIENEN